MAANNAAPDDPGPQKGSGIWWSVWPRRTGIGAIAGYKARWPNLGHKVAHGTIANILKARGLEPAPERNRKTTWKEFLL
jgi:hypothetical protein